MIGSRFRYLYSITKTNSNPLQTSTLRLQPLKNSAQRIEVAIFQHYSLPQLISSIDSLPLFKNIATYNPALANGGSELQQFPLVKLLHIGLKMIETQHPNEQFWRKFENIVKVRLHRCTVQQHMRLLFMMLKVWPIYRFNPSFISSICLGLKKQLNIMSDEELKSLMRVTAAGIQSPQRFQSSVLVSLQSAVVNRVLQRWQNVQISKKHSSLQGLYSWLSLTAVLSLQNKPQYSVIEDRVVRMASLFNKTYLKATLSEIVLKQPSQQNLLIMLEVLSAFEPVYRYYRNPTKDAQSNTWSEEFGKLRLAMISHSASTVSKILQRKLQSSSIHHLNCILSLIDKDPLQNLLNNNQQQPILDKSYPQINKLAQQKMNDRSDLDLIPRLKLLLTLIQHEIMSWDLAKLHYQSLQLSTIKQSSLVLTHYLLQLELYFYLYTQKFQPRPQAHRLITDFLSKHEVTYRNFDWLAFHYLRLVITKQLRLPLLPLQNTSVESKQDQNHSLEQTLINKLILQAKTTDKKSMIEQEKDFLQASNRQMASLKKFFIQVRLHELQILEPIIAPFFRLPHFSNQHLKIALNAYSQQKINSPSVLLQKRLLNELGWKVINVKMPFFVNLTTGERVSRISAAIQEEDLLIARKQRELLQ